MLSKAKQARHCKYAGTDMFRNSQTRTCMGVALLVPYVRKLCTAVIGWHNFCIPATTNRFVDHLPCSIWSSLIIGCGDERWHWQIQQAGDVI